MNYLWDNIFRRDNKKNDVRSALRQNILFQDLSDREIRLLSELVHIRRFHPGEPIFRQNEVGVGMYIILKGRVEIFVSSTETPGDPHRDIFITQLIEGDFFGELSLVEENGRRTATAVARDDCSLIGFFKPDLIEVLSRNPSAGTKIVMRLAEVLGRRLKETTDKVSELRRALKELRDLPILETIDGTKTTSST